MPRAEIIECVRLTKSGLRMFSTVIIVSLIFFSGTGDFISADTKQNSSGRNVSDLLKDLNSPDPSIASNAIFELKGLKISPKEALPALVSALKNQSEFVRLGAVNAISEFGAEAQPAVPSLIGSLKDRDPLVREAAVLALMVIGLSAKTSSIELASLLGDENNKTRDAAVTALASFGVDSIPILIKSIESGNARVANAASDALARIGTPAVEPLILSLRKGGPASDHAVRALSLIGKPAALPLIKVLKEPNQEASGRAADALVAIGAAATPALVEAVRGGNNSK